MAKRYVPEAGHAEAQILSSILSGDRTYSELASKLRPADFYYDLHRDVFSAMESMHEMGMDIDFVSLSQVMKESASSHAMSDVIQMGQNFVTSAHFGQWVKQVGKAATLRRMVDSAKGIYELTQPQDKPPDIDEVLTKAEKYISEAVEHSYSYGDKITISPMQDYLEAAKSQMHKPGGVSGLSTGYKDIDDMTQGFVGGELMIIAGQTSHGKTQLATNIGCRIAKRGEPVLFVTLEMTKEQMTQRLMDIEGEDIDIPMYYQGANDMTYHDVRNLVKVAKDTGIKVVMIDHLHYFVRSLEHQTNEIGMIVKNFKQAAIEFDIPVILISHVRKIAEGRRPTSNDLRDSSFIGQDADMVIMVWRNMNPDAGAEDEVEVVIQKNRSRGLFPGARKRVLYSKGAALSEEAPKAQSDFTDDIPKHWTDDY